MKDKNFHSTLDFYLWILILYNFNINKNVFRSGSRVLKNFNPARFSESLTAPALGDEFFVNDM